MRTLFKIYVAVFSLGMSAGIGFMIGRAIAVPGTTEWWKSATQPTTVLVATLGAVTAALVAYLNGQLTREQDDRRKNIERQDERRSELHERYSGSAKMLADDKPEIRAAGAHSLVGLVDDWHYFGESSTADDSTLPEMQACVQLLCSYLRGERRLSTQSNEHLYENGVRSTICDLIRVNSAKWRRHGIEELHLAGANLQGSDFHDADLTGANLELVDFTSADLTGATLTGANCWQTKFVEGSLHDADLSGAILVSANFYKASLIHANLSGAELSTHKLETELYPALAQFLGTEGPFEYAFNFDPDREMSDERHGVNFSEAALLGLNLRGADLSGVNLTNAMIASVELNDANLTGAELSGATLLKVILAGATVSQEQLESAYILSAILPNGEQIGYLTELAAIRAEMQASKIRFEDLVRRADEVTAETPAAEKETISSEFDAHLKSLEERRDRFLRWEEVRERWSQRSSGGRPPSAENISSQGGGTQAESSS
ncbi:pentapeptide repeat-containing protein [Nocardia pseudovaccinii]|uniref:pentapeptide repeat-containing protein n=1 Tax=Nocardia pseudovaccinii TaxID=189540 RepID=UPI003D8C2CF1